jgi:type IV secretory pathway VirD2 relaxase
MSERSDDMFRVKPRAPKCTGVSVERRFLSRVKMEVSKLGGVVAGKSAGSRGRGAKRGRGWVAARLMDTNQGPRARRVVIKTRLVVFKQSGPRSAAMHLRYIVRAGVGRDGQEGQPYGSELDTTDVDAFEERSRGDRHQFRFIVAPEDAVELDDLRTFTRHLMERMERDLGTHLEWVAVDHWDTDNPHTHVVLRGKDQAGENLVIGREYITHGMRTRAGELATNWLGPRTEREIQAGLEYDVQQDRYTALDRKLRKLIDGGVIDLRVAEQVGGLRERALLIGRVQHLQTLGLTHQVDTGRWQVGTDLESTLRALGERRDIIRTMQRTFGTNHRELAFGGGREGGPVIGRIAARGMAGEAHDEPYILVDALDGRAHHVALPKDANLADFPVGSIVEARRVRDSIADRNIAAIAEKGWYLTKSHIEQLRRQGHDPDRAKEIVEGHVRRLEALRRVGIAKRVADGVWEVPVDLVDKGKGYDQARFGGVELEVHSHLPIEKQVRTIGATWLDRQLLSGGASNLTTGFGAATRQASSDRLDFLVGQGLAEKRGGRAVAAPNLLNTLRDREIAAAAAQFERQTGLKHRPITDCGRASGIYRRSIVLVSGRFAMLDDGLGFTLVPWRAAIDGHLGKTISAVISRGHVSWQVGRQLSASL